VNPILWIKSHSSTNPANLVKIGPMDVQIISLKEIVKNMKERHGHSKRHDS